VIRDKKEQNLNLTLPDRKESGDLLMEESSDQSTIDAESAVELGEVQQYVARLQPQLALASEDARESLRELRKDLCSQQQKLRHQAEKLSSQSRMQREQLKKNQDKLKMEMDELRRELRVRAFDI
jgi:hypothetical protein